MKLTERKKEFLYLAKVAITQSHAVYSVFIHGFVHKFMFLSRTTPIREPLLKLVEDDVKTRLLPAWTGRVPPSDPVCELFTLPAGLGELDIINPTSCSSKWFLASSSITAPCTTSLNHSSQTTLGSTRGPIACKEICLLSEVTGT